MLFLKVINVIMFIIFVWFIYLIVSPLFIVTEKVRGTSYGYFIEKALASECMGYNENGCIVYFYNVEYNVFLNMEYVNGTCHYFLRTFDYYSDAYDFAEQYPLNVTLNILHRKGTEICTDHENFYLWVFMDITILVALCILVLIQFYLEGTSPLPGYTMIL